MVNLHLNALKLALGPDKTFIGRFESTFNFLGYRFGLPSLALAEKTITNAVNRVNYPVFCIKGKQKQTAPMRAVVLNNYITRWLRWVVKGIDDKAIKLVYDDGILTSPRYPLKT